MASDGSGSNIVTPVSNKRLHSERNSPDFAQGLPKAYIMSDIKAEDIAKLKAQRIPQWGLSLLEILNRQLTESVTKAVTENVEQTIRKELNNLETKIESSTDAKCERVMNKCMEHIDRMSNRVDLAMLQIEGMHEFMRKVDTKNTDRLIRLEDYSRRNNLLFSGFEEVKDEKSSDCVKKIRNELAKIPGKNLKDCKIERCHRNGKFRQGKSRDIIVKFLSFDDRKAASEGRSNLSQGIFVRADHAKEISNANRALRPVLKTLEGTQYATKGRVQVRDGFIYVDAKRFSLRNLYQLPKGINYYQGNHASSENSIAWFGILSPYSNFHWAPFSVDDGNYVCPEQFISASLARKFDQEDIYVQVMATVDPYEMKRLAYRVKESDKYVEADWHNIIPDVAYKASLPKYKQNQYFAKLLLETGDKTLGEATSESPWGCGLKLDDIHIKEREKWPQVGIMGETLMRIRSELRKAIQPPGSDDDSGSGSGAISRRPSLSDSVLSDANVMDVDVQQK